MSQWQFLSVVGSAFILGGAFSSGAVARNSSNVRGPDDVEITAEYRGQSLGVGTWELQIRSTLIPVTTWFTYQARSTTF